MITLRWSQLPEADVASYKVYRSIIGFSMPVLPLSTINGKTLILKFNGGSSQTFTFNNSTSIVDLINATASGGQAYLSSDALKVIIRSNLRSGPDGSVQIVGGTALSDFGLTARTITEKSEDELIASVVAPVDPATVVEYLDEDGTLEDYYAISTIDSLSHESLKTAYRRPIESTGLLCVIEGVIFDIQGRRVPNAEVKATIQVPPESTDCSGNISVDPVSEYSGPDGRFSLPLLQKALVRLEIPAIGLNRIISIPEKSFVLINDIRVDLEYRYPLNIELGANG